MSIRLRWISAIIPAILLLVISGCQQNPEPTPTANPPTPGVLPSITLQFVTRTPVVFLTRTPTPNDGRAHIGIGDNYFEPQAVTVKAGTEVEWWHGGNGTHTITSLDGKFPVIFPSFASRNRVKFDVPGLYTYVCAFHAGMGGTIRVVE